ncbi:CRAL-TRIO domain-containing protein [Suillus clintonianus]|uniref:CRAL-TRIO domain-containing protein n=1 Tax=Suillus clintonianus TaxID=1904413 RepID=UPI001B8653A0|nr:CRAL-TRIO domain-containing protein [Suillus clintonianus]KAG2141237.1 CRAL-TRIO domain-containing protein [Suillus clintonianus]
MTQIVDSEIVSVAASAPESPVEGALTATTTAEAAAPQPGATPTVPELTPGPGPTPTLNAPTAVEATQEDDKEPHNALTEKFTDAEWKALKEFRSTLPETFKEAFPEQEDAESASYNLWGVTIHPLKPKDARVSVVLMKFLRARNLNPAEAKDMFISTLRWRKSFNVDEAMKEKFPEDVFGKLGRTYGKDKDGHPIAYNLYGANKDLDAVFGDTQRFLRWRVAFMEESIALLDFETIDQMIQIHDYEGVGMSSRTPASKNAASEASSIFQGHYPEFLAKKFFVNVPSFLTWIFWIFKPLLSAATVAKMSVVGSGPKVIGSALLPLIPADQLPKRYGGDADGF